MGVGAVVLWNEEDEEEDAVELATSYDDIHESPVVAPAAEEGADDPPPPPPPSDPPFTVVAATQPKSMTQKRASKCLTNSSTAGENCGRMGVPKLSLTCSTQGRPPPPFSKDLIDPKI